MRCPDTPDQITFAVNNWSPFIHIDQDNNVDKNTIEGRNRCIYDKSVFFLFLIRDHVCISGTKEHKSKIDEYHLGYLITNFLEVHKIR